MTHRVEELNLKTSKLAVCLDLYDEIKRSKIDSHEDYIKKRTKLEFLKNEILTITTNISKITKEKENVAKSHIHN